MDYLNNDILNIIIPLSTNQNCFLVCKQWYENFKRNLQKCQTCNKVTKIYDKEIWATDEEDDYCHEYKGTTKDYKTLKEMIQFNPNFFRRLTNQTHKLCEMVIRLDTTNNIKYIQKEFKDEKICLLLAKKNSIEYIPEDMITEEMYVEAVKSNSYHYLEIPENKRTLLINLEAVK